MFEARNIEKHYGGVYALKDVSFSVAAGEVHALCGENGAGKSSLAKILTGVVQPDGGTLLIDGRPGQIGNPAQARKLGVGIVFQELDLFEHLTIAENMTLASAGPRPFRVSRSAEDAFCAPFLKKVGLDASPRTRLGDLSIAAAQLVAIARALSMNARFLLLDEPTSSLTEEAADRLLALVLELKNGGTGIVYVSHKMKEIFRIADRVTVLRDGRHISTRAAADTSIEETIKLMVGRELEPSAGLKTRPRQGVGLKVDGLSTGRLKEISLTARCGEVLGIAGLVGAGRSELGEALFGMDEWKGGEVTCSGKSYRPGTPRDAIKAGFAYLPEDRRTQGLFLKTSVRHNASAAILPEVSRAGWINRQKEETRVAGELALTRTKAAADTLPVGALSGGNQQKVLLAKWLLTKPEVLFLDDPTRGVDVGAKADIYRLIEALAEAGKTILFVSSELTELLNYSHRIMVLCEGRCAGVLETATATQEQIMALAAGGAMPV